MAITTEMTVGRPGVMLYFLYRCFSASPKASANTDLFAIWLAREREAAQVRRELLVLALPGHRKRHRRHDYRRRRADVARDVAAHEIVAGVPERIPPQYGPDDAIETPGLVAQSRDDRLPRPRVSVSRFEYKFASIFFRFKLLLTVLSKLISRPAWRIVWI
jgi:hypothetical protein